MFAVDKPSAAALRSSIVTPSSVVSSKLVLRRLRSIVWPLASSNTRSRAATSASWPWPFRSFSWKLKPAFEPKPRTAGGSTTKMRASRSTFRSSVALRAMASACCSGRVRSLQSLSRKKPRAEAWSPLSPVMALKLTMSGCWAK